LDRLLADPGRFATMQKNARKMGRPKAAHEIAKKLIELTE
jgi:UDP-N-acetylglucosamine:LPS N-acetylglucosamine transferase